MESGGGRGKGKKGKKKAVSTTHQSGKKGSTNAQVMSIRLKTSAPSNATEEGLESTKGTQDQLLLKTKQKRLKKVVGGENSMKKEQMVAESGSLKTNVQVHDQLMQKSPNAVAIVTSNAMSLKGATKKKRKRNVTLKASTGTSDSDRVMTTVPLKEETSNDGKKSLLIATQSMKKKASVRGQSPSTATVTKQTVVGASSLKRTIAQVEKVSTKLSTQRTRKSERVTTTVDVPAAMASLRKKAKNEKVKEVRVSAGSTSMLPNDESQVVVKKLKPKVQQPTRGADASKQMGSSVRGTLVLQQVPQADAAITAKPKDEVTTTSLINATMTKEITANADSGPSTAAFDDKTASSKPAPDSLARNPAVSSKPSHIAAAAASLGTVYGKPVLQERMPGGATNPSKTSPALVASAFSPQLATARLVTTPIARSKVTDDRHKRRRSIDQASVNYVTDPLQPPKKRSAGSSKDASCQMEANGPNEAQSFADGERAALDQVLRHHAVPEHSPVTVQETHESAMQVVGGQAMSTVEVIAPPSQFEAGNPEKTESVNVRRCATQPTQLLAQEPVFEHETSLVQTQAASSSDCQPLATQLESAVKAEIAASAIAPRQGGGVGPQSIAASFESAATKEVGIVMDSRTYVQKMMSTDTKTSSHGGSSLTQSVQSITRFPPRPRNAWGASFGMVPPPPGASSVSRTLSITPLSSWFLSKGCANFVKQVQFSDDDDAGDSSSSEEDVPFTRQSSTLHGADKVPIKRRALATKKNAFLESLTTQSYWRTWYGTVDLHNLIDPPLVYVPDKLRTHEVTPLSLSGPRTESDGNTPVKKNDLKSLEADIRQEKQRGSAFSEQLLMMLQGKTVSGKPLEEEYRPLLRQ